MHKKAKVEFEDRLTKLILHSKYLYLTSKLVFEEAPPEGFKIKFGEEEIIYNEYSLIHILNRHYAWVIKQNTAKSYHIEEFEPRQLQTKLKHILEEIGKHQEINSKINNRISFKYKDNTYSVWVKLKKSGVKGKPDFLRLETFYPVVEKSELETLEKDFKLTHLTSDLQAYSLK